MRQLAKSRSAAGHNSKGYNFDDGSWHSQGIWSERGANADDQQPAIAPNSKGPNVPRGQARREKIFSEVVSPGMDWADSGSASASAAPPGDRQPFPRSNTWAAPGPMLGEQAGLCENSMRKFAVHGVTFEIGKLVRSLRLEAETLVQYIETWSELCGSSRRGRSDWDARVEAASALLLEIRSLDDRLPLLPETGAICSAVVRMEEQARQLRMLSTDLGPAGKAALPAPFPMPCRRDGHSAHSRAEDASPPRSPVKPQLPSWLQAVPADVSPQHGTPRGGSMQLPHKASQRSATPGSVEMRRGRGSAGFSTPDPQPAAWASTEVGRRQLPPNAEKARRPPIRSPERHWPQRGQEERLAQTPMNSRRPPEAWTPTAPVPQLQMPCLQPASVAVASREREGRSVSPCPFASLTPPRGLASLLPRTPLGAMTPGRSN